jgi:ubiquinone/menaquinone biosynthesis C-methylase UbiE
MSTDQASPPAENPAREFYNRISKAYDLLAERDEHIARELGLKLLAASPGESALEIGFGTGHALVALTRAVGPTGKVDGLEVSDGMLEVARNRVEAEAGDLRDRVELRLGDARSLPYADGTFDLVFMSFTLELFEASDIPRVLAEIRRVLKPGGRLGVVSLATVKPESLSVHIYRYLHRHFPHFIDCQPIDVTGSLKQAGYAVRSLEELSIWGLPVHAVVATPEPK